MSDIAVKAVENHRKGYNCAQAVACAFADRLGIDEKEIFKTMEATASAWALWERAELCRRWRQ